VPFGPWAVAIGFLVSGSQRVYFAGDTALFPEMAHIDDHLDLALLPVWGWGPRLRGGHLDPPGAAEALTLLRPRRAMPIHWGTFWPAGMRWVGASRFTEPGGEFQMHAQRVAPEVEVLLAAPGDRLTLAAGSNDESP
jgi:L-ascorbate metabolism protein UlaG (beta-lactamase superfamily)